LSFIESFYERYSRGLDSILLFRISAERDKEERKLASQTNSIQVATKRNEREKAILESKKVG
jgi:hypothetical protein